MEGEGPLFDCEDNKLVAPVEVTLGGVGVGGTATLNNPRANDDEVLLAGFEVLRPSIGVKVSPVVASVWSSNIVTEIIGFKALVLIKLTPTIACSTLWQYQLGCLTLRRRWLNTADVLRLWVRETTRSREFGKAYGIMSRSIRWTFIVLCTTEPRCHSMSMIPYPCTSFTHGREYAHAPSDEQRKASDPGSSPALVSRVDLFQHSEDGVPQQ